MPPRFEDCGPDVYRLMDSIIGEYYPMLRTVDARINLLFAHNDDGPAIAKSGHAVAGLCKINNLKDRAEGKADATITLDGDRWFKLPTRTQRALLHHELHHLIATNKRDALKRPTLKMRPDDWMDTGFAGILRLYGTDSLEWKSIDALVEIRNQKGLPFNEETTPSNGTGSNGAHNGTEATPAADEPKWRDVPVGSLGLQVAVADALLDAELRTAGAVSDFIDAREDLSGLDGIGPDDEEAISGAIDDLIDLERSGVDPTNRGGAKDADDEPEPEPQPRKRGRPRKAKASP
jgi:hypothetical protein